MKHQQMSYRGVPSDDAVIYSSRVHRTEGNRRGLHRRSPSALASRLSWLDVQHDWDQDDCGHLPNDIRENNRVIPLIDSMPLSRQRCRQSGAPVALGLGRVLLPDSIFVL